MKTIVASAVLIFLLGLTGSTVASPPAAPANAAKSLNAQSKASLGVSIRALSYLFAAKPGTLLLKDSLVQDGSWPYLQELERAGYVRSSLMAAAEGEFVQISLTAKGRQVAGALGGR